ncbi:MAG: hypothetical protein KAI83_08705 [Thiomargarita sp.]|nr:hypothetical protein [Thiomargarita sp.]
MAFSDYKNIEQVQKKFHITYNEESFIQAQEHEPPPLFLEEFAFNQQYLALYTSEGSRTEAVIFPILREVYKSYSKDYELWIQKSMRYDEELTGTPDYIIATRSHLGKTVLTMPILIVVEAKRNDFEQGWGQCLAELVAAQKLNENEALPVYGIVTDGKRWEFGKLLHDQFTQNSHGYSVDQLAQLFGVLQFMFDSASSIS